MPNLVTLTTKLAVIKGILPKFISNLAKLEITTVHDLLWHFPSRYDDFSKIKKIGSLVEGESMTVRAEVKKVALRRAWKKNMFISEAIIADETGGISVTWFNQPFISKSLKVGTRANFAGKVFRNKTGLQLYNPAFEILKGTTQATHTAGIIPIYPETRGLTSKGFRFLIHQFLEIIGPLPDFLPPEILEANQLPELSSALKKIHFPRSLEHIDIAKKRFAFEYIFLLQLNNIKLKMALSKEHATPLPITDTALTALLKHLPFTLTEPQQDSLKEIVADLAKPTPMNRLLQGDVGSGKTVVAALGAMITAQNGHQAAFMAPTEVLARQHYHTLTTLFSKADFGIALLTGSEARTYHGTGLEEKTSKAKLLKMIADGTVRILVGTHSLVAGGKEDSHLKFHNLSFVVVDEQHRFGVEQRAALVSKRDTHVNGVHRVALPHFLSMSATPIPRTLSLAIFGDLDVSVINELPQGRKAIITKIVAPENRAKANMFIREHIKAGRQAFFIYPRIETTAPEEGEEDNDGEKLFGNKSKKAWSEVKTVKAEYEVLSKTVFPGLRVEMLHGKMKPKEKAEVMAQFKAGKIDVLASTSVIEVGVDVANATIMVIEGADRFGLAQLYQFRGRVGRGDHQSFCFLFTDSTADTTTARLNALLEAKNGFELAEKDLQLRGPGQFLGQRQTGLPDIAMDSLSNTELIKSARDSAQKILAVDPELKNHPLLKEKLEAVTKQVHLE